MGNHDAHIDGVSLSRCVMEGIEIHHFPVRTYAGFENKIVTGGQALKRNTSLPEGAAITWRRLYERWQAGDLAEWYSTQQLTPEKIKAGLASGELTVSTMVRDAVHAQARPSM